MRHVNLFMVGAAKSGTTTLHKILASHPDVYAGPSKEPHFFVADQFVPNPRFAPNTCLTEAKYEANYAGATTQKYLLDSSVHYMAFPGTDQRIHAYNPNAKIIFALRHPVDRLYSHYKMLRKEGVTRLSFEEFLTKPVDDNKVDLMAHSLYSQRIREYQATFGSSNVLIITFNELNRNQQALREKLAAFLDISPFEALKTEHENVSAIPKNEVLRYLHMDFPLTVWLKRIVPKSALRAKVGQWIIRTFYVNQAMAPETRQRLNALFEHELAELATLGITFER